MTRREARVEPLVVGLALTVGLLLLAAPAAASASAPTPAPHATKAPRHGGAVSAKPGDLVVLSGDVVVRKDETSGDVVVVHGSVRVAGVVRGDVVVFDGPVTVSGVVHGDLVALDGPVALVAGAHVTGDVTVAHGKLVVQVGTVIDGKVHRGSLGFLSPARLVTKLGFWIGISVSTLLLGLVLVLLAPRGGDAVARAGRNAVGASIGWGALAVFGLPVAAVVLLVTLVGLPFGVGLLLALALLYSIGYAFGAWTLGRVFVRPSRHGGSRRLAAFLAGWAVLRVVGFLPILGGITWFLAAWYGLGAATVAIWRARREPVVPPGPGRTDPGFARSDRTEDELPESERVDDARGNDPSGPIAAPPPAEPTAAPTPPGPTAAPAPTAAPTPPGPTAATLAHEPGPANTLPEPAAPEPAGAEPSPPLRDDPTSTEPAP